ncbi:unnamed protein product [Litomosoides sigmodontis]|uniref:Uncharacterized protein n=1 Tax=Litomosoides sigmodontis TaxID=42156 RepID=A0A3P6SZH5_LITSI|nr:unnamed protein product [Litomosoides sigmodontis]
MYENDGQMKMKRKRVNDDDKEHSAMLSNPEPEDFERQLFAINKRAGAHAFGSVRANNFENLFYPTNKRQQAFSPYYYYQQLKRGGGHPFHAYWTPSDTGDAKLVEGLPFYKKRSPLHDFDEYTY